MHKSGEEAVLGRLLKTYRRVFEAHSPAPMPDAYETERARLLIEHSSWVECVWQENARGEMIAGTVWMELPNHPRPPFIPEEIWHKVVALAESRRPIYYHTASFKTPQCGETWPMFMATYSPGCHFYATLEAIHRKVSPSTAVMLGTESFAGEERTFYGFTVNPRVTRQRM